MRDYNKEIIKDVNVRIYNKDTKEDYSTLLYVNQNGIIKLILAGGDYLITLGLEDISNRWKRLLSCSKGIYNNSRFE